MAVIVIIEIVWLLIYLTQKLPFILYIVLAIVILVAGLFIWDLWLKKEHAKKQAEQQIILTYGSHLTDAEICERKKDPRYRNQKRGRGPRNCNLDPESCEVCGSLVKKPANDHFFWQTKHLCCACEQRYKEAQGKGIIPHIAGYTDNKEHGESNQRELWVKQQIAALDLRDGVIDEDTARAEVSAAEEAGKQWAAEQETMRERERQQTATRRDEEEKSHLNEDVQRLLN